MTQTRKRFIAGAECPACNAQDTLMLTIKGEQEEVSCVQCGHTFSERGAKPPATEQAGASAPTGPSKSVQSDSIIGIFKPE